MLLLAHRLASFPTLIILLVWATAASAQQPLGELYATGARVEGSISLAGTSTSVLGGSSIEAGTQIATLKLQRGGNLLVCPGTKVVITESEHGQGLVFNMNNGSLEMNYPLSTSADTLLTPDLRLLMPGPGTVHVAVHVTPQGDTCVQSLAMNAAAVTVSETKGEGIYQVRADNTVVFQGGRIRGALPGQQNCGCPAPQPTSVTNARLPAKPWPAQPSPKPQPVVTNEHVSVEGPSVVRAGDPVPDLSATAATPKLEHNKPLSSDALPRNVQAAAPRSSETHSASGYKELAPLNAARDRSQYFAVQVGAFKVKDNAYRLADYLKSKRYYEVEILQRKDSAHQLWYLVRVGRYADRVLARSVAAKLASEADLGLKPFICEM